MKISDQRIQGFLVVLRTPQRPASYRPLNSLYRGVDRLPPQPSDWPGEKKAMDEYVFGPYRDPQSWVIEDIYLAVKLLRMFKESPREFELIYLSNVNSSPPISEGGSVDLGYDVTGAGGDFYSGVGDFPESLTFRSFFEHLNEHGLFPNQEISEEFLRKYGDEHQPDWNRGPWTIFRVWNVKP